MRNLRIIFMGTPDFAVSSLQKIIEHQYNVVGVITAPDKPAGRGRKLQASAVKKFAVEKGLQVLQPTSLKDETFIETLRNLNPNLFVVVAFRMLPKVVWSLPEYGTFNLHASLLPQYRGAAPINWAIIHGEQTSGVTTFFIDDKIDTGHIIAQKEVAIHENDTAGSLHDTLMDTGASLVVETIKMIQSNTATVTPQPNYNTLKPAPKLFKDNTKIDWDKDVTSIYNFIRGLSPYPVAWSHLSNQGKELTVKIYEASIQLENHTYQTGSVIIDHHELKVAVKNGFVNVHKLQIPGKKAMHIKALLNGYSFDQSAKIY